MEGSHLASSQTATSHLAERGMIGQAQAATLQLTEIPSHHLFPVGAEKRVIRPERFFYAGNSSEIVENSYSDTRRKTRVWKSPFTTSQKSIVEEFTPSMMP